MDAKSLTQGLNFRWVTIGPICRELLYIEEALGKTGLLLSPSWEL